MTLELLLGKKKRCPFTKNALMPSGIFSMTRERHGPKEALFWPNLLKLLAESEKFHFQLDIRHYLNSENDLHTHKSTYFKWAYLDDWADIGWHMLASQCNFFLCTSWIIHRSTVDIIIIFPTVKLSMLMLIWMAHKKNIWLTVSDGFD